MPHSMTGYGKGEINLDGKEFVLEIKSVNSRYCDMYIKLPRNIMAFEEKIRAVVGKRVSRGKLDIMVNFADRSEGSKEVILDKPLATAYVKALEEIRDTYSLRDDISASLIARFPDVLSVEKNEDDMDALWAMLAQALDQALKGLNEMRAREGKELKKDLLLRGKKVITLLGEIVGRAPIVTQEYKVKLEARICELVENRAIVDEGRLALEVAMFADKCAIDEEVVRLESHMLQMTEILDLKEPVGRKLDFLVQEMNREANTIGSKSNDTVITRNMLEIKSEIEKIREQVQNIE
ncbi:MAG: YicC/YloC family endoribonuclease [Clostridia bacterium]